jgi:hypothetical protein
VTTVADVTRRLVAWALVLLLACLVAGLALALGCPRDQALGCAMILLFYHLGRAEAGNG